jgi:hypothetical protein
VALQERDQVGIFTCRAIPGEVGELAARTMQSSRVQTSSMITALLILHGLAAVALLGAITHQSVSVLRLRAARNDSFIDRYTRVRQRTFTVTVVVLYLVSASLGAVIYPNYRLNVRIPFEEMSLGWAVGVFELKEHFAGIALGALPLYAYTWRAEAAETHRRDRIGITLFLAFIVWWDFLLGHVLNNIRGLA